MAIKYSLAHRNNAMTTLNTDIGTSAQIIIYSGAAPADVATAPSGTLLVQFAGNATAFGSVGSGALTAGAVATVTATATGTAGYFRINTSGGTAVVQGTCGLPASGADMILTNTNIVTSQSIQFTSMSITAFGA